ncbi:DUF4268 domain-containing protein [Burkholderia sp. Bp8991]|uniref:DUF4268 domain-containing protein n=1 Tax=Burkholderia sp. Bp8991 TaxID=2184553 RepID=UPI000F5AC8CB|nr:DUF4268 domain-containing protein [Burkholderia sp. Bp8991]RQS05017.1 DUF4268 domain-containing protein [Burkholderia sp. Bp8991]
MLGKLERVVLRDIWANEAFDFTPWLASHEGLAELSRTLGMELEVVGQEHYVGPYRADLLCTDTLTDGPVLIENQLEKTDHSHLGQILTYAAGLGAKSIIWVAATFTAEHRAVLDWLNEITDKEYSFFGLEIELWRIGESPAAPKFNIVCRPNTWARTVKETARSVAAEPTGLKQLQLQFWNTFADYLQENARHLIPQAPGAQSWMAFKIGRSKCGMAATMKSAEGWLGAGFGVDDVNKGAFKAFEAEKDVIQAEFGGPLDWQELPGQARCRIGISKLGFDITNETEWPAYFRWLSDALVRLDKVFRPRVRAYRAESVPVA